MSPLLQNPIESRFDFGMIDALNAEIALGTVANVDDGVRWLGYTYLFVRMRKNPLQYGKSSICAPHDRKRLTFRFPRPNVGQTKRRSSTSKQAQ